MRSAGIRAYVGLLLSIPALAQTPSIVHILSDDSQVLVGRTLKMRAVVRDSGGNAIPSAAVTWAINQAQAGSIAPDGTVTAKGLATFRVTARSGSVTGEAAIQSIPSRVEVTPSSASLDVGSRMQFRATAYDADGAAIPGVTFTWSLTNQRQGGSSLGRIDNTGMVTATGEGGIWVWATYTYSETFPGLQRQWVSYSPVDLAAPKAYELRKLYSTLHQKRSNWTLRARQSMLWSTDEGDLFFNASLGGLANAFLNWRDGRWRVVSGGGVPRFGRASMALDFRSHSITRDGQILSYEDTNINGAELNLGTRDGLEPFLNNNVPLGQNEATSGLFITRNSYTSTGWAAVRANFRFVDNPINYVGLFRGSGRVDEMLVSTKDPVPELNGTFSIDADFGIAADGTAVYSLTSGSARIFYRHDFGGRKKLVAVGDEMLGSKVRSFIGGSTNYPSVWFDDDGTALVCALLEDNTQHYLSFAPDGKMTSLRLTSQSGILWRHPAQGVLIYANPYNNQGNGVYLWKGDGAVTPVYKLGVRLLEQTIQAIESGTINKQGDITLMLRGDSSAMLVTRMNPEPHLLFGDGNEIPVELPVNAFTLIGGARTGRPHVQAGGNSGSIAEFAVGDFYLTLGIGERLFGNTMWFGGSHGSTYNMRKAPNGDIYFTNGSGIGKIVPGDAPQLALPFPLRLENNLTVNTPGQIDVNGAGALLFQSSTSAGDNRIFIHQNGVSKQLLILSATASTASTIEGRIVQSLDSFAFDDTGRVLAQLRFRGLTVPVLALWDADSWRIVAMPNQTRVGEHLLTSLPNTPRASGSKLMSGLTVANGANIVAQWQPQGWETMVNISTAMPNGQVANSIGAIDVNAGGDLLFQFANGVNSLALRRGDKLYQVHNFFRPTPQGDFLLRMNSMDLRDDGTVYMLAVTQDDEVVLYEARPLF